MSKPSSPDIIDDEKIAESLIRDFQAAEDPNQKILDHCGQSFSAGELIKHIRNKTQIGQDLIKMAREEGLE